MYCCYLHRTLHGLLRWHSRPGGGAGIWFALAVALLLGLPATPARAATPFYEEGFSAMPAWSSTYDAPDGAAAPFTISSGGLSRSKYLRGYATYEVDSVRALAVDISGYGSTVLEISIYMRAMGDDAPYLMQFAYRLGEWQASDLVDASDGWTSDDWTIVQQFSESGGNGNQWLQYSSEVAVADPGATTLTLALRYRAGTAAGGPSVGWETVEVQVVGHIPVLQTNTGLTVDEGGTGAVTAAELQVTDEDNAAAELTYTLVAAPAHGRLLRDGEALAADDTFTQADIDAGLLTYAHDGGEAIADSFTFTVSDGAGSSTGETAFAITVTAVNDAPTVSAIDDQAADEDTAVGPLAFTVGDAETAADDLTVTATSDNPDLLPDANLELGGSGADRTLTLTPAANASGTAEVTLTVSDGELTASTSFTLTVNEASPPRAGIFGTGLDLDGNDAVIFDQSMDNTELTVAAWINLQGGSSIKTIVGNRLGGCDANASGWAFHVNSWATSDRKLKLEWSHDGDNCVGLGSASNTIVDNEWTHVAVTFNTGTGLVKLYKNGVAVAEATGAQRSPSSRNLAIGRFAATDAGYPFNGQIDEVQIWHRELTEAEIRSLMYTRPAGDEPDLVGYWPFEEGFGATTLDGAIADGAQDGSFVSDPAFIVSGIPIYTNLNTPVTVPAIGQDDEGEELTVTGAMDPEHGTVAIAADGTSFTYTPDANYVGADSFEYTVSDGGASDTVTVSVTVSGNAVPEISTNAGLTVDEGGTGTIGPAQLETTDANDAAADLKYSLFTPPAHGTLYKSGAAMVAGSTFTQANINSDGITYTHDGSEETSDSFYFDVSDGAGGATAVTPFAITVTPVNDPPTITAIDDQTADEDAAVGPLAFTVGDAETAAADLTVTAVSDNQDLLPDAGIAIDGSGADRALTLTPTAGASGTAEITVTVNDGELTASTSFTLTVNAVNAPPVLAANAGLTVDEGGAGTVTAAELQVTDDDNAPAELTYTLGTAPANGTLYRSGVALAAGGTFTQADIDADLLTYTHDGSETSSDGFTFTFTVSDGAGGSIGDTVFEITVTAVNEMPAVSAIADQSTDEDPDTPLGPLAFTVGDAETAADDLAVTATSDNQDLLPDANLLLGGDGTDRTLTLTPAANASGSAIITVTVSDGTATATTSFTLTVNAVNDPPVLAANAGLTLDEGATATITTAKLAATDVDNAAAELTYTVGTAPTNGTLYRSGVALTAGSTFTQAEIDAGDITYTHDGSESIADSFTFTISDGAGGSIDETTFAITVTPVNAPPMAWPSGALAFNGIDTHVNIPDSPATRLNNSFTIEFWLKPASTAQPAAYVVARDSGAGKQASILFNNPAGAVSFYAHTYTGNDPYPNSFLTVTDTEWHHVAYTYNGATWSGYLDGEPVFAVARTFSLNSDPYDWWLGASSLGSPFSGQLDELRIWTAARSAAEIKDNFRRSLAGNEPGLVAYYRFDDESGDTLTDAVDNGQDGALSANPPDWVPSTAGLSYITAEETDVTITLSGYDPDGDVLSAVIQTLPSAGTLYQYDNGARGDAIASAGTAVTAPSWRLIFAPAADGNGSPYDSFGFVVYDGSESSDEATVTVHVTAVNDPPVLAANLGLTLDEGATATVTAAQLQVTDVDNAAAELTYTVGTAPANGTLYKSGVALAAGGTFTQAEIDDGDITYTHDGGESIADSFTFTVSDGAGGTIDETAFAITVTPVNDKPTISAVANQTADEDTAVGPLAFTVGDAETTEADLTLTATSSDTAVVPNENIVFGGSGADRTVKVTPAANASGSATITVTVSDGTATATTDFTLTVNAVNDPPVLTANAGLTLDEGATAAVTAAQLQVTDVDNAAAEVTYTVVAAPAHGMLSKSGSPLGVGQTFTQADIDADLLTYTHDGSESIGDNFTFTVSDGAGGSIDETTFAITVTPVNDKPTVSAVANQTADEDTAVGPLNFTVHDAETDEADLSLTATSSDTAVVPNENIVFGGSGTNRTVKVTPAANASGSATITVTVSDGTATATTDFTLTVNAVNDPPVPAANLGLTLDEGATATVTAAQLQVMDVDNAAAELTYTVVTAPANGTLYKSGVALAAGGTFTQAEIDAGSITYTHDGSETTADSFTFTVSDGTGGSIGETAFAITVTAVNDAPTISDIDHQAADEDTAVGPLAFTVGDAETAAADLAVTAVSDNQALVPDDSIVLGGSGADRTLTLTPAADASGSATITVTVSDGTATSTTSFTLTVKAVNDPPVLAANLGLTLAEGATATMTAAQLQVTDVDNAAAEVTYTVGTAPAHGTLYRSGVALAAGDTFTQTDIDTGAITYTHDGGESIADSFTFTVSDGAGGSIGETAFANTVTPVNDAPTISDIDHQTADEDTTLGPLAFTVYDAETPAADLTVTATSDNQGLLPDANLVLGGSGADRTLTLTPAADASGSATITVTVSDGTATSTTSFTLTVKAVNDPPVLAANAGLTLNEGATANITSAELAVTDVDNAAAELTYTVGTAPGNGTLYRSGVAVAAGGTFTQTDIDTGVITYTHDGSEAISDGFTFTVNDGADSILGTVFSITVTPDNDKPTISDIANQTADEDTAVGPLAFTVGDAETPADELTVTATSSDPALVPDENIVLGGSGADRTLTLTPAADASGSAILTVTVSDGTTNTTTSFTLTVNAVNDPPVQAANAGLTVDEGATGAVITGATLAVTDVDNAAAELTYTLGTAPGNGTLYKSGVALAAGDTFTQTDIDTGAITYTHDGGESIADSFTFTVSDGAGGSTGVTTFSITVTPVNDKPTISAIADQSTNEDPDKALGPLTFTVGDAETPVADLTVRATSDNQGLLPDANLVLGGSGADKTLTLTPAANASGSAIITITVSDGTATATTAFTLTVNAVNDRPALAANAGLTVDEGGTGAITSADLAFTDVDNAAADLTYTLGTAPANGTLYRSGVALATDGTFTQADIDAGRITYTHDGSETTSDSFTFTVNDGAGGNIDETAFAITVTPVDDTPTLMEMDNLSSKEGNTINPWAAVGADADGDTLTYSAEGLPDGLSIDPETGEVSGTLSYTAAAGSPHTVTVTVTDDTAGGPNGDSASRTFTWTVVETDTTPTLAAVQSRSDRESAHVSQSLIGADADGDALTYTATGLPPGLSINAATGVITGRPYLPGVYTVTVTVTDDTPGGPEGGSASQTFTWRVREHEAPAAPPPPPESESPGAEPETPETEPETSERRVERIEVPVHRGATGQEISEATIERTIESDGTVKHSVEFAADQAAEAVENLTDGAERTVRIYLPDPADVVAEQRVELPKETLAALHTEGANLEIFTEDARVVLPAESLSEIETDVYFRVVPVKQEEQRKAFEQRVKTDQVVVQLGLIDAPVTVGRPATIETNLPSRWTEITLPVPAEQIPTDPAARARFQADLAVFIEHSDGETEIVRGETVPYADGKIGYRFSINKFSVFTLISLQGSPEGLPVPVVEAPEPPVAEQEAAYLPPQPPSAQPPVTGTHYAYVRGYPDGEFKPELHVTRAQMAAMLARAISPVRPADMQAAGFPDVPAAHWASSYIGYAQQHALLSGYPDGDFRPEVAITRAEMAAVASRMANLTVTGSLPPDSSGHWAADPIARVTAARIMSGYPDGTFRPDQPLTRAEATAVLNRMLGRGPLTNITRATYADVPTTHWAFSDIEEACTSHQFRRQGVGAEEWVDYTDHDGW